MIKNPKLLDYTVELNRRQLEDLDVRKPFDKSQSLNIQKSFRPPNALTEQSFGMQNDLLGESKAKGPALARSYNIKQFNRDDFNKRRL